MKRWALLVVVLYAMFLAAALMGTFVAGFFRGSLGGLIEAATERFGMPGNEFEWGLWIGAWVWIAVFVLAQVALLVVPVKIAAGKPVRRRAVIWPLLASIVMLLIMVAAMYITVYEHLENTRVTPAGEWVGHKDYNSYFHNGGLPPEPTERLSENVWLIVFSVIGGMWLIWAFLFGFYAGGREPRTFMSRVCRFLLAGSILELLVAVPAHVIARQRDSCCGGFYTFVGLVTGISVMLLAFGPGVFMLIARRVAAARTTKYKP